MLDSYEQLILVVHMKSGVRKNQADYLSALSLFVLWIFTDYSDTAFSLDDLAFFANWFNR